MLTNRIANLPLLVIVLLLYAGVSVAGGTWGLPSRAIDRYLFAEGKPWTGQQIARLAKAADRFSEARGADVDRDPLDKAGGPIHLTGTDERAAAIYLRYRLYTHQPDEMITMMALAQMRPGSLDLDPRLYQYGGLFIYPVGALVKLCGLVGLIEVRSDLTYYLDNPDEFGKFYVVARAYAAAWGLVGVVAVYLIASRLHDRRAGLVAALLFVMLPVVVCMSHEGKPHLPGAALMLLAVWFAMQYADSSSRRHWLALCITCGASLGMVLSSLPILVLIPLVEVIRAYSGRTARLHAARHTAAGIGLAAAAYAITNPYVPINLIANREVLRSNFGNSLAMYEIDRLAEGLGRMLSLTVEGATLPVLLIGVIAMVWLIRDRRWAVAPLAVPAGLFFVQFVLIGAGKPAEYGRFGLFANAALVVAAACGLTRAWKSHRQWLNWVPVVVVAVWVGVCGYRYLRNFVVDAGPHNSRILAAQHLATHDGPIAVLAEPAPYCCPPLDFANRQVRLFASADDWTRRVKAAPANGAGTIPGLLIATQDRPPVSGAGTSVPDTWQFMPDIGQRWPLSPICWANKPVCALEAPK
jgi:hypothetical protein